MVRLDGLNNIIYFKEFVCQKGCFGDYLSLEFDSTLPFRTIKITNGWTRTGSFVNETNHYTLDSFRWAISYLSWESNGGIYDSTENNYNRTTKKIVTRGSKIFLEEHNYKIENNKVDTSTNLIMMDSLPYDEFLL